MDEAIRRKLLADAEAGGDDRRLALLGKLFYRWSNDDHTSATSDTNLRKIQQMIGQSDCTIQKSLLAHEAGVKELDYYGQLSKRIAADINVAHQRISECRKALQDAKQIRKHRQEYDAMATLIKQHRSRKDSIKLLDELKAGLGTAAEKRDQCLEQLEQRRKQLHVLFVSLRELSDLMNKTSRNE
jgi:THO complex subunit 7